ncbi:MAG: ABC transporter ATP-binding protein [bacterium]|nr:ABC transporter ATP-binding protein [bacterium]
MTPGLQIRSLSKVFASTGRSRAEVAALTDIDFDVQAGEIYCLLGPSGCGKSTILNIVAGFERMSSGEVAVGGQPVSGPSPERAFVFQQPQLFPWLDVWENIMFGPSVRSASRSGARERAESLLAATGLTEFRHHHVYQLSGGMRQRVAIARALINQPSVLLMDEPFGALDAQTRIAMQELLLSIWDRLHTTILFITHDVEEALFLGDHVGVMTARPGRMKFEVPIPFERPRTVETLTLPAFVELKKQVMVALREEVRPGPCDV